MDATLLTCLFMQERIPPCLAESEPLACPFVTVARGHGTFRARAHATLRPQTIVDSAFTSRSPAEAEEIEGRATARSSAELTFWSLSLTELRQLTGELAIALR